MRINIVKFGKVLSSRPAGREAFLAIRPTLDLIADIVEIGFGGIISLAPSWADEFFSELKNIYGNKIKYLPTDNKSVIETLRILELK